MKKEVVEKLGILITGAFGLVAALAWNGAIQTIFAELFGTATTILAMLLYAVVITVIAVIVTVWIGKLQSRVNK